ncbi:MAG: hypothetical protein ACYC5G_00425 [Candidatus Doudnabacteria bacterium]
MEYSGKNAQLMRFFAISVLIVLLAGLTYWYEQANKPKVFPRTDATEGQIVSGFPEELLMGAKNPKITQSYLIDYGKTANQYSTQFTVKADFLLTYLKYKVYLQQNGYYLSNDNVGKGNASAGLYATKKDKTVNVLILQGADKKTLDITVSYVEKGK